MGWWCTSKDITRGIITYLQGRRWNIPRRYYMPRWLHVPSIYDSLQLNTSSSSTHDLILLHYNSVRQFSQKINKIHIEISYGTIHSYNCFVYQVVLTNFLRLLIKSACSFTSMVFTCFVNNSNFHFYLLLLFSWPPGRVVWPDYEVVMFQPRSGTATSLGSVANVTSYLSLIHHSTVLWILTLQPPCPDSLPIRYP